MATARPSSASVSFASWSLAIGYFAVGYAVSFKIHSFIALAHAQAGEELPAKLQWLVSNSMALFGLFVAISVGLIVKDFCIRHRGLRLLINGAALVLLVAFTVWYPMFVDIIHMPYHTY